jgi:hypothetical protein
MPGFTTKIPHPYEKQAAIERLNDFLPRVREQYKELASDVSGQWEGDTLKFAVATMGMTVQGTLTVEDRLATVQAQLPLAAAMFAGRIEDSIRKEVEKVLS